MGFLNKKGNHYLMKNVIVFFIVSCMLLSLPLFVKADYDFEFERAVIVTSDKIEGREGVKNGNDFYYTFYDKEFEEYEENAKALVFYLEKFDCKKFLRGSDEVFKCQDVEGMQIYEGYNKAFDKSIFVEGKKINFQLVINGDRIVLGIPMIVTGF